MKQRIELQDDDDPGKTIHPVQGNIVRIVLIIHTLTTYLSHVRLTLSEILSQ